MVAISKNLLVVAMDDISTVTYCQNGEKREREGGRRGKEIEREGERGR
jgi:hypothetical protein